VDQYRPPRRARILGKSLSPASRNKVRKPLVADFWVDQPAQRLVVDEQWQGAFASVGPERDIGRGHVSPRTPNIPRVL
jgi:hypothetical protein